jgi:hypothetical protein
LDSLDDNPINAELLNAMGYQNNENLERDLKLLLQNNVSSLAIVRRMTVAQLGSIEKLSIGVRASLEQFCIGLFALLVVLG